MNPQSTDPTPHWLRMIMGDTSLVEFTGDELDEAARIIREGARAYRQSVVIPFDQGKIATAIERGGLLAAADSDWQDSFPIVLAETDGDGAHYRAVGHADLLEPAIEDVDGHIHASLRWRPEGATAGFEGLVASIWDMESGDECGRGVLMNRGEDGWLIEIDSGRIEELAHAHGRKHTIILVD